MKMILASLLAAIRGPLNWQTILHAFPPLRRFLCEPPRRRTKQCDTLKARLS